MWAESATSGPPVPDGAETIPTVRGRSNPQMISVRGPGHLNNAERVDDPPRDPQTSP
jgi:hypothetical protein